MLSTCGAFVMMAAALVLVWNVIQSLLWGEIAPDNPWQGWTLEWATTSPPPQENFHELPRIQSRRPLWDLANPARPDPVVGSPHDRVVAPDKFKVGILAFIASEVGFFAILILAYLLYSAKGQPGPSAMDLSLPRTLLFSACLFASSFTIWRSEVELRKGNHGATLGWLITTFVLGSVFMLGQGFEYWDLARHGVGVGSNLFTTSFFTLTGFHGLHVCLGLFTMMILIGLTAAGDFKAGSAAVLESFSDYWHFVDVVWVFVLTVVYILPLSLR
jgi:heme/copper-type cytochrome/quinol oxidase subunit 3